MKGRGRGGGNQRLTHRRLLVVEFSLVSVSGLHLKALRGCWCGSKHPSGRRAQRSHCSSRGAEADRTPSKALCRDVALLTEAFKAFGRAVSALGPKTTFGMWKWVD